MCYLHIARTYDMYGIYVCRPTPRAVLSQGEPRDAAVNLNGYRIEFYKGIVRFLCHSTAFVYRYTSATVQMLNYSMLIFTALTQNHGDNRKSRHTTKITVKATVIMNTCLYFCLSLCHLTILVSNRTV